MDLLRRRPFPERDLQPNTCAIVLGTVPSSARSHNGEQREREGWDAFNRSHHNPYLVADRRYRPGGGGPGVTLVFLIVPVLLVPRAFLMSDRVPPAPPVQAGS
jgi:hypothetical protein